MVDCESEFRKEADLFLIRKFKAKASLDELYLFKVAYSANNRACYL